MGEMKRYAQRCPVARALDVVGERWSLLVIRELLVGPRRYSDLQHGLPGIGSNVLATRLRGLKDAGIITQRVLPPPAVATIYELTEAGRALGPTLGALRTWGMEHGPQWEDDDAVRPSWVLVGATSRPADVTPGKVCALRVDGEHFTLESLGHRLELVAGPTDEADVTITLAAVTLYLLALGHKTPSASRRDCTIEGDTSFATEILDALHNTVR